MLDEDRPKLAVTDSRTVDMPRWVPLPPSWCNLNTDGSLVADGSARAGMVLRGHMGTVVFPSCRQLFSCREALEVELRAAIL